MILTASVLAQLLAAALTALLVAGAAGFAAVVLRRWDPASGGERQLALERGTYLVSTLVAVAFAFQLAGLFLFVHGADALAGQLAGAMCATGTLGANRWGYPALGLQVATFLLAGVWLVVNAVDNRGEDYPLVRSKYGLLLAIAPVVLAGAALQWAFLLALRPDVLTACCGTVFAAGRGTVASWLAEAPPRAMATAFFGAVGSAAAAGVPVLAHGRGALPLAALSALALPVTAAALVSFIGPYVYELPTHHCPFCVLQGEYGHVGYALYLLPLAAAVLGVGAGVIAPAARTPSLSAVVPRAQRGLVAAAVALWALLAAFVAAILLLSDLRA